jgi:hypothetical protein
MGAGAQTDEQLQQADEQSTDSRQQLVVFLSTA